MDFVARQHIPLLHLVLIPQRASRVDSERPVRGWFSITRHQVLHSTFLQSFTSHPQHHCQLHVQVCTPLLKALGTFQRTHQACYLAHAQGIQWTTTRSSTFLKKVVSCLVLQQLHDKLAVYEWTNYGMVPLPSLGILPETLEGQHQCVAGWLMSVLLVILCVYYLTNPTLLLPISQRNLKRW